MATSLPYIPTPGNVTKTLEKIKTAQTPAKVTKDFVKTKLKITSPAFITSYLKKIGFTESDGSPSNIYEQFRNDATSSQAVAKAIRKGYAPLYEVNEYMHDLDDKGLKNLIIQVTGQANDSRVIQYVFSCIKNLKDFASFEEEESSEEIPFKDISPEQPSMPAIPQNTHIPETKYGMNLSYTINLNLPATTDINVFNSIFKSLKENLLRDA